MHARVYIEFYSIVFLYTTFYWYINGVIYGICEVCYYWIQECMVVWEALGVTGV